MYDNVYQQLASALADLTNASNPLTKQGTVGYLDTNGDYVIPVEGEGPRIYVTVDGNALPCINTGVPLSGGFPIIVLFQPGREPIALRPEAQPAAEYMAGALNLLSFPHSHRWGQTNVDLVEGLRMEPGLVLPTDNGLQLSITAFNYAVGGERFFWDASIITPVAPGTANKQYWAIIGIDTTVWPHAQAVVYGAEEDDTGTLTEEEAAAITFPGFQLAGYRIQNGQSNFTTTFIADSLDMRPWVAVGYDYGFPSVIPAGQTVRVLTNRRVVTYGRLEVLGRLEVNGGVRELPTILPDSDLVKFEISSTTATMSDTVFQHNCNGAAPYTLTLPTHKSGKPIKIVNRGAGAVALSPTSGLVKESSTETLLRGEALELLSDGTDWT